MSIKVGRHFEFEASHKLPNEEQYGACSNLHGHRYELDIELEGEVTNDGWVCNFSELKEIVQVNVLDKFDHGYLNDYFKIPTAENIVIYIDRVLSKELESKEFKLSRIRLYETRNCYVEIKK